MLQLSCNKDEDTLRDAVFNTPDKPAIPNGNSTDQEQDSTDVDDGQEGENQPIDTLGVSVDSTAVEVDVDSTTVEAVVDSTDLEELVERGVVFPPIHDAYLQQGEGFNLDVVRLDKNIRTSYLMFDLSQIDSVEGQITSAALQFTVQTDNGHGTIKVLKGASNSWTETNLSDASAPAADVVLGSIQQEFRIGSEVDIELNPVELLPEVATMILTHSEGDDFAFASKESKQEEGARLVVNYEAPESYEAIVVETVQIISEVSEEEGSETDTQADDDEDEPSDQNESEDSAEDDDSADEGTTEENAEDTEEEETSEDDSAAEGEEDSDEETDTEEVNSAEEDADTEDTGEETNGDGEEETEEETDTEEKEETAEEDADTEDEEDADEETESEEETPVDESETDDEEDAGEETETEEETSEGESSEEQDVEEPSEDETGDEAPDNESEEEETSEPESESGDEAPEDESESDEEESSDPEGELDQDESDEEESSEPDDEPTEDESDEDESSEPEGEPDQDEPEEEESSESEDGSGEEESDQEESSESDDEPTEDESGEEDEEESSEPEDESDKEEESSEPDEESTDDENSSEDTPDDDTEGQETPETETPETPTPPAPPTNTPPITVIVATTTSGTAPLEVTFTGDNSSDDKAIVAYAWDFKDGGTSDDTNPTHIFEAPGTYEISLQTTDEEGLSSAGTETITVEEPINEAPTAVAQANSLSGEVPLTIDFTGSNSSDDKGITEYNWSFPGGTSTEQNTSFTFENAGDFNVTLTVADEQGLSDTTTLDITVTEPVTIASKGQIPCGEGSSQAATTGRKIWCWSDLTLPEYSGHEGELFDNRTMAVNSECYEKQITKSGNRLKFRVDPVNPSVGSWCPKEFNMRAEVRTALWDVRNPPGTEEWFGWSYTFGNDYEIDENNQWKFFQVHNGIDGTPPQIGLEVIHDNQFRGHQGGEIYVVNECHGTEGRSADFSPTGITPRAGQTIDVVVHAVWENGSKGLLQVWINGNKVYDKQVSTLLPGLNFSGNGKWGIYKWPWEKEAGVQKSLRQGITHLETYMGTLRMITRRPGDPDYGTDSYDEVAPN